MIYNDSVSVVCPLCWEATMTDLKLRSVVVGEHLDSEHADLSAEDRLKISRFMNMDVRP